MDPMNPSCSALCLIASEVHEPFISKDAVYHNIMSEVHSPYEVYIYRDPESDLKVWYCLVVFSSDYKKTNENAFKKNYAILGGPSTKKAIDIFVSISKLNRHPDGLLYYFRHLKVNVSPLLGQCKTKKLDPLLNSPLLRIEDRMPLFGKNFWVRRLNAAFVNWVCDNDKNKRSVYMYNGIPDDKVLQNFWMEAGVKKDEIYYTTNRISLYDMFKGFKATKHKVFVIQIDDCVSHDLIKTFIDLIDGNIDKMFGTHSDINGWKGFVMFVDSKSKPMIPLERLSDHCYYIDTQADCLEATADWAARSFDYQKREFGYDPLKETHDDLISTVYCLSGPRSFHDY